MLPFNKFKTNLIQEGMLKSYPVFIAISTTHAWDSTQTFLQDQVAEAQSSKKRTN